jgi:hypothetical protein
MMDDARKRSTRNMALIGGISGLIVSCILYLAVEANPAYLMFTVFGALIGGAQGYLSR